MIGIGKKLLARPCSKFGILLAGMVHRPPVESWLPHLLKTCAKVEAGERWERGRGKTSRYLAQAKGQTIALQRFSLKRIVT